MIQTAFIGSILIRSVQDLASTIQDSKILLTRCSPRVSNPAGVWVDGWGHVYVVDCNNFRVMLWKKGAKQGTIVAGGDGHGVQANKVSTPSGLFFDHHGYLYVADRYYHRVQCFPLVVE